MGIVLAVLALEGSLLAFLPICGGWVQASVVKGFVGATSSPHTLYNTVQKHTAKLSIGVK